MKLVKTKYSEVLVDEDGIVHMSFTENIEIDLAGAKEIHSSRLLLDAPKRQLLLVDLRSNPRPNWAARQFSKDDEVVERTVCAACIVGGLLSKMVGNLIVAITAGKFPTKLFTSTEEAMSWLKTQQQLTD